MQERAKHFENIRPVRKGGCKYSIETMFLVWRFSRRFCSQKSSDSISSFYFLNFELSKKKELVQSTDKYG